MWIKLPVSVALPFGVFETILSDDINKVVTSSIIHYFLVFVVFFLSFGNICFRKDTIRIGSKIH